MLADTEGNVLTLGERECSIQRRHQKLIEESPSTALTPKLREEMESAAEIACDAIGYRNAGRSSSSSARTARSTSSSSTRGCRWSTR